MGRRRAQDALSTREEIEYDELLDGVSRSLENLDRPGACFTSGSFASFPHPGIVVTSHKDQDNAATSMPIPLPLTEPNARHLIEKCRLAPYGHGEQTLVDTSVRNTWELNAQELTLTNPQWASFTEDILKSVRMKLGISPSAIVEAKLYKLLLYEEGGKFERHQDSEKEPGMFGTLVVVLPGEFKGGELLVHQPSAGAKQKPHLWNPGEMSAYDVKYAAFYGDCAHEVKPVTSGYRLCLTYNLVTTTVAEIPHFAGSTKLQEAISWSLAQYFTEAKLAKRPKYGYSSWNSSAVTQSLRHFVYLLEHDYSDQGLRFDFLKNKDHLVARSLAKFCEETKGTYVLYLSRLRYSHVSDVHVDDVDPEITVTLQSPWVKYGTSNTMKCPDVEVDHVFEVAPAGCLEDVEFDDCETHYTGNEGTRKEQWYESAALVIQPAEKEFEQLVKSSAADATSMFVHLVDTGSPNAAMFGSMLFGRKHKWTSASPAFVKCLKAVQQLQDFILFIALLKSTEGFEYQPLIGETANFFGFESCRPTLIQIAREEKPRSQINFVTSLLYGSTDLACVAQMLAEVDVPPPIIPPPKPTYSWRREPEDPFAIPKPEEFSMFLEITLRGSSEKLASYLMMNDDRTLVKLVFPAFQFFVTSFRSLADASPLINAFRGKIESRLPALLNAPFGEVRLEHDCERCQELKAFLAAETTNVTRLNVRHKTQLKHVESTLKRLDRHVSFRTVSIAPIVVEVSKIYSQNELHEAGVSAVTALTELLSAAGGTGATQMPPTSLPVVDIPPLQPAADSALTLRSLPPVTSIVRPPVAASPAEIIVIDDSD